MKRQNLKSQPFLVEVRLNPAKIPSWEEYPFNLPAVRHIESVRFHPSVTFFVGENGTGKSTLLEAIATGMGFNPEGGSRNFQFATRMTHSPLHGAMRLSRSARRQRDGYFFRAESYYNVATEIDELDEQPSFGPPIKDSYGGRSLHEQSHGESFLALFANRLGGEGLYIVDEPEAALSPTRQLSLLSMIHELVLRGSQFIIATHSPILMAYPKAKIYLLTENALEEVDYTATEHFSLTRAFLNDHRAMLRRLLGQDVV